MTLCFSVLVNLIVLGGARELVGIQRGLLYGNHDAGALLHALLGFPASYSSALLHFSGELSPRWQDFYSFFCVTSKWSATWTDGDWGQTANGQTVVGDRRQIHD
jgi:hypothetical protein